MSSKKRARTQDEEKREEAPLKEKKRAGAPLKEEKKKDEAPLKEEKEEKEQFCIRWIWGPSCSGKTLYAKQYYPDAIYIDGDDCSELEDARADQVVVLDDYEGPHLDLDGFNNLHLARAKRIIILSNNPPNKVLGEFWSKLHEFRSHCCFYETSPRDAEEGYIFMTPMIWDGENFEEFDDPLEREIEYKEPESDEIRDM